MDLATPTIQKTGNNSYSVSHGNDDGLWVEFESVPKQNLFESEQQGRPIFKDVDYIKIIFPGDKTKAVHRPVKEEDKLRFSKQWEVYQKQGHLVIEGTPIEQWAPLTKSEVAELKAINIHTVESLAALPDTALSWLGARTMRDKAKAWLAQAVDGSAISALIAKNESQANKISALEAQVKELATLKTNSKDKVEK